MFFSENKNLKTKRTKIKTELKQNEWHNFKAFKNYLSF